MAFIEVLNSDHYTLIEQIEEIADTQDRALIKVRNNLIKELFEATGFEYKI